MMERYSQSDRHHPNRDRHAHAIELGPRERRFRPLGRALILRVHRFREVAGNSHVVIVVGSFDLDFELDNGVRISRTRSGSQQ